MKTQKQLTFVWWIQRASATGRVLCKDASIEYRVWAGFKSRVEAKRDPRALPVLLNISRVDGVDLIDGEYVQGCLLDERVYAVIDSQVSIVRKLKA